MLPQQLFLLLAYKRSGCSSCFSSRHNPYTLPFGIDVSNGVAFHIGVSIQTTAQSNRITLHVPPSIRIVIPEIVIAQLRLRIINLPRKPKRYGCDLAIAVYILFWRAHAISISVPAPYECLSAVCSQSRCIQVIDMQVNKLERCPRRLPISFSSSFLVTALLTPHSKH